MSKLRDKSFGQVGLYRTHSARGRSLFGTDLKHTETIRLEIKEAEVERMLNKDWYYGHTKIIEIEMSPTQFAELITSMNTEGVPCSIIYRDGETIDIPEIENTTARFKKEFNADVQGTYKNSIKLLEQLKDKFDKKTLNKADKEEIIGLASSIERTIQSNLKYVSDRFDEEMERKVQQAKAEIEAYIEHKIKSTGIETLKNMESPVQLDMTSENEVQ